MSSAALIGAWNASGVLSLATGGNVTDLEWCDIVAFGSNISSLIQQILQRDPHIMKQSKPDGKRTKKEEMGELSQKTQTLATCVTQKEGHSDVTCLFQNSTLLLLLYAIEPKH